jgi:hypothetical protein
MKLEGEMKHPWRAGLFAAAFCAISAPLYFAIQFSIRGYASDVAGFVNGIAGITAFALLPSVFFGFILGIAGGALLAQLSFIKTRTALVLSAGVLGALLGCIPPVIPRLFPPTNNGEILSFVPCVLIGTTCAMLWTMLSNKVLLRGPTR